MLSRKKYRLFESLFLRERKIHLCVMTECSANKVLELFLEHHIYLFQKEIIFREFTLRYNILRQIIYVEKYKQNAQKKGEEKKRK